MSKWKALRKRRKGLAGILLIFCVLAAAACYTVFIAPLLEQEKWIYKETAVERGALRVGVTESGSLDYGIKSILYELDLDVSADDEDTDDEDGEEDTSQQKYLKVEEVYVAAGQRIAQGDALLKFTDSSVSDVRRLLNTALVEAQTAYHEAESEYTLALLEAETDYETQKVVQDYADTIYRTSGSMVDNDIAVIQVEIDQRTSNITSLEEKLVEADEDYREALAVYEDAKAVMEMTGTDNTVNFMTIQSQYLSARNQYQSAKTALEKAQEELEENQVQIERLTGELSAVKARRTIDQLGVEQTYQESMISGENAQITYNARAESLKEELQEAEEDKKNAEEQAEAFETFVGEDGILYADGSGIVTEVGYQAGDSLVEAGAVVKYAAPDGMTLSVDVTQEDVVSLAVGDKAEIWFSAYEDTLYEGVILSIDTTATSRESATVSYTVVVGVEGDTELLYGGMTADITFVTEEKEDVLYVSKKAVLDQNGKQYVYIGTPLGGRELQEVETGISNGSYIEIVSGLEEGDTVYIASRVSSESEVKDGSDTL